MVGTATVQRRVERLNAASSARIVDPDRDLPGRVGDGQLIGDDLLLSTAGLDPGHDLSSDQRAALSREVLGAITSAGIHLEAVLMAGFALRITEAVDYTDPRITYLLHEMGEETRHSRLFVRLLQQLRPAATNPLDRGIPRVVVGRIVRLVLHHPALLYTMVLAGEEIPDLLQKLASEDPATDPFVAAVNRYHREEEARHLAFARTVLPEVWQQATAVDRLLVRFVAPLVIREMYENMVHAGVFAAIGLRGLSTWRTARTHPGRVSFRQRATRPVLAAVIEAGVLRRGSIPRAWRDLCGVDVHGRARPWPGSAR